MAKKKLDGSGAHYDPTPTHVVTRFAAGSKYSLLGKIGLQEPLPLSQSADRSMGITAWVTSNMERFFVLFPVQIFLSLKSYCSRLSVGMLSYNSRVTLIRLDRRK